MFRVAFLGRGRLGLEVLEGLLANPAVEVPIVIACAATPEVEDVSARMGTLAAERGIDFFETNRLNNARFEGLLAERQVDLAVAMLWLHTIDERIIRTARLGFINCHGGHLPKYRGNACANWAILNGEPFIGISTHLMTPGQLDNGPVILQDMVEIGPDAYIGEIIAQLEERGRRLVLDSVEAFRTGAATPTPQDESEASYCYPRLPRDGEIDWAQPSGPIHRLVRAAGRPYPGAYSWFMDVRAGGTPRKLVIWRAHVEHHPLNEFYAVPGHLLRLDAGSKWGIVCGDRRLLILDDIMIDDESVRPEAVFKTVRQRMGLDLSLMAAQSARNAAMQEPTALGPAASRFAAAHGAELERRQAEVSATIDAAARLLADRNIAGAANPLRNLSFQKRWFDWEKRERLFGVQIYRSLRLTDVPGEPFAVGYWLFGNESGEIEPRLYVTVKDEHAAEYGMAAEEIFRAKVADRGEVSRSDAGHVQGIFAALDWTEERLAEAVADLAEALARRAVKPSVSG
jgi:methionyl-tRNA formyltransferase